MTTIWVCTDCLFAREGDGPDTPDREPWNLLPNADVTLGLLASEHETPCGSFDNANGDFLGLGCDCENIQFSSLPCAGCGSTLAGERQAYTIWEKEGYDPTVNYREKLESVGITVTDTANGFRLG